MSIAAAPAPAGAFLHEQAPRLLRAEYARFLALLRSLDESDWSRPTDCTRWDVRTVAAHVVTWAETMTIPQLLRVQWRGRRLAREVEGGELDGMNEMLVRESENATGPYLVSRLRRVVPRSVAARASVPLPLRRFPVELTEAKVSLGFVSDHIYTRDTWIHRVDISRATARPMLLTPDHDGRIVEDIAADWAERHGRPYHLVLDGPAGGDFSAGSGGEEHRLDAVEFCRLVSGRGSASGLLATRVPF
jgi:uncharacterized protein (TIGR03083 family)